MSTDVTCQRIVKLLLAIACLSSQQAHCEDPRSDPDATEKQQREEIAQGSRLRAQATEIIQLVDGKRVETSVVSEPLFRYIDEPRDILDGTLWAYGTGGRPVALQKIEVYRNETRSLYCMTSFSENLIEVAWRDGRKWSSKQPGIRFQQLPEGPEPAATEVGRLIQMKQIARRFKAKLFNPIENQDTQMRPLARPIYRYHDADQGIVDGVIFGYATYGTNPDTLLSIELHRPGDSEPAWRYALARMTLYKVTVTLDDKEVWEVPFAAWQGPGQPSMFDTWLFFHEASDGQK